MQGELRTLEHTESTVQQLAMRFGPKVLAAVLVLVIGFVVGRWVGRATARALRRAQLEPPLQLLLVRVVRLLVLLLFGILALQNLGVELLPLVAGLGVAGAGVALATQGVLSNVVAGLTIIFTKPYRIGETVAIIGVEGVVESITLFSTTLRHADMSRVVVPNRKIVGEVLHNYGTMRQCQLEVHVPFDVDLPAVLAMIEARVRAHPRVLGEPAAPIQVSALADSTVRITASPWVAVKDFGAVEGELYVDIVRTLRQQGVALALPLSVRLIQGAA